MTTPLAAFCAMAATLFVALPAAAADGDIAGYFKMYYEQQVAGAKYDGPLDFLRDAATAHAPADKILVPSASRSVTLDRPNGYLQLSDGAGTDQTLTMTIYRKADGNPIVLAGSSNCADACSFLVQVFAPSGDRLQPVAPDSVIPAVQPAEFFPPGQAIPKALASQIPKINYLPARLGTTLTLKPWYGYEIEEQMDKATRAAIRTVTLSWDRAQGRFVKATGNLYQLQR
jgi:hypothetical protein